MSVTIKSLVDGVLIDATATSYYEPISNVFASIDKATAFNSDTTTAYWLSCWLGTVSNENLIFYEKVIQPLETVSLTSIVGHYLSSGIPVILQAETASKIAVRISGREIT